MPANLPHASTFSSSGGRFASSEDVVGLTVRELEVDGRPAELEITATATPPEGTPIGANRAIGDRLVTVRSESGLNERAPHGSQEIDIASAAFASWYELGPACPFFSARLGVSTGDPTGLEEALAEIIASLPRSPVARVPDVDVTLAEAQAWTRIRSLFPTGPVAMPTWLPEEADRSRVTLRRLSVSPTREYEVVYPDRSGEPLVTFRLGPVAEIRESGSGLCCVRAARAIVQYASHLFGDPTKPGIRRVKWTEQTRTLSFWSERIRGEDMLRIAWALDRETVPPNPYDDARAKPGACARDSAVGTIERLLSLTGSLDRAAVLDCYALDAITADGTDVASWAGLPRAGRAEVVEGEEIAGRRWVSATWTFGSDPGGAWGRSPTFFFLLGEEDGAWRVYDGGTGPGGSVP